MNRVLVLITLASSAATFAGDKKCEPGCLEYPSVVYVEPHGKCGLHSGGCGKSAPYCGQSPDYYYGCDKGCGFFHLGCFQWFPCCGRSGGNFMPDYTSTYVGPYPGPGYCPPGGPYPGSGPFPGFGPYPGVTYPGTGPIPGGAVIPPIPGAALNPTTLPPPATGPFPTAPGAFSPSLPSGDFKGSASPLRATIIVRAPKGAKLFAEGRETTVTDEERSFYTPELKAGTKYQYSFRLEYVENKEIKRVTREVPVVAGANLVVDFMMADLANSKVTVKLPANSKLKVNGADATPAPGVNEFVTPGLQKGSEYIYEFVAEVEKDGRKELVHRQVKFLGGEPISVDLTLEDKADRSVAAARSR